MSLSSKCLKFVVGLSILAACALAAFCFSGRRTHAVRIAIIPQTTGTALWSPVLSGAKSVVKGRNVSIYWNAPTSEGNVRAQISLVERAIQSRKYDGIVLAPDHSLALMDAVQDAEAAGIPVVVISSRVNLPPGPHLSYILNNDAKGGDMAAEYLGHLLHDRGTIGIMGINPALDGNMERERSFEAALRKGFPGIKVVSRHFGAYNIPHETQVAASLVKHHPALSAIVALNSAAERGAWNTLLAEHKARQIKMIGFNQNIVLDGEQKIRISAIVAQNTQKMGQLAVRHILDELHHKHVRPVTWISPRLVTGTSSTIETPAGSRHSGQTGKS